MVEIVTPFGMQLFMGLYWIAGLSGIMLGTLAINQGFFERFFDIQLLLIVQGSALVALGGGMFIVATGMMSGARWSLNSAKRIAGISVVWAALGVSLAVYTAYNLPGLAYSIVLYGILAWLVGFGVTLGLMGLRYLSREDAVIRRYAQYVSTEVIAGEDERVLLPQFPREQMIRPALPPLQRGTYCSNCGATLGGSERVCPRCGARRDIG